MTQAEDDAHELEVRRRARELRDEAYRTRAAVTFAERARDVVAPAPPPVAGARSFMLSAVGPGWVLYTPDHHWAGEDLEYPGQAGTVVEVLRQRHDDQETGEIVEITRYRCLATWRPSRPWSTVDAGDVDTHQLAGVDRRAAAVAIRWLVRPVASGKGLLSASEQRAVVDAWRLAVVLGA
jgi:hypothetical protein